MKNIILFVLGSILFVPSAFALESGSHIKMLRTIQGDWKGVNKQVGAVAISQSKISKTFLDQRPGFSSEETCHITLRGYGTNLAAGRELIVYKGESSEKGVIALLDKDSKQVVATAFCTHRERGDFGTSGKLEFDRDQAQMGQTLGFDVVPGAVVPVKPVDTPADAGSAG